MTMSKEFIEVSNYKEEDYRVQRQVDKWNDVEVPKEGAKTFIKHIAIAPFVLEVSAEIKLDQLDTQAFLFFGTILNALGVVITNIDGAPISLDGIVLQDCVDTLAGINQKLMNHYKNTVIKQFYKIFGSLNIIGNPMGLFRNISTGFKDLKDKPSEGLVKGPLEFGKGMVEGTSSLIAHSIGGALNSVSKVTGTISTGLAVLAFDK
jgi:vacuolar protein sorting-associated protein 13A/C